MAATSCVVLTFGFLFFAIVGTATSCLVLLGFNFLALFLLGGGVLRGDVHLAALLALESHALARTIATNLILIVRLHEDDELIIIFANKINIKLEN